MAGGAGQPAATFPAAAVATLIVMMLSAGCGLHWLQQADSATYSLNAARLRAAGATECPVLDGTKLTRREFEELLVKGSRPAVITGAASLAETAAAVSGWRGGGGEAAGGGRELAASLAAMFGEEPVTLSRSTSRVFEGVELAVRALAPILAAMHGGAGVRVPAAGQLA